MGRAILSKSLIQVSSEGCCWWWWTVLWSLPVGLLASGGPDLQSTGSMVQTDLTSKRTDATAWPPGLQMSVPLSPWQAPAGPRLCRRPSDMHRRVWFGLLWITAPFPWDLLHTRFCLCPPSVSFSPSPVEVL